MSIINPHTHRLIAAAEGVQRIVDNGELFAEDDAATQRTVAALDELKVAYDLAREYEIDAALSPAIRHRKEIMGGYSNAGRLRMLVAHLYNGRDWKPDLTDLLASADTHHTLIALELVENYANRTESDPAFMSLAREIVDELMANTEQAA